MIQNKNKTSESIASRIGLILMAAATVLGMSELAEHKEIRVLSTALPAYATAHDAYPSQPTSDSNMRRERDEAGSHQISYGISMRTPSRTGKL